MDYTENIIGDYHNGFRPNRGTVDNIHILRQITEKTYEHPGEHSTYRLQTSV
jgi:hypothetical protein